MKESINLEIRIKDLKLLPQTRAFVDTRVSKASKWFLLTVLFLIIALIIWASFSRMDDVVVASAVLRPVGNISSLNIVVSGEVVKKYYAQNQVVKQGDLLLQLDSSAEEIELEAVKLQLNTYENELKDYQSLLSVVESSSNTVFASSNNSSAVISNYITEYEQLNLQVKNAKARYDAELKKPEVLQIKNNTSELYNDYMLKETQLKAWKSQKLVEIKNVIQSYAEKIDSQKMRISALERGIRSMSVYAPIDGRISEIIQLNEGDYILAGTEVLRVIPQGSESLKAEIVVSASNVARVKEGQVVKLRFPGLPPSKFGQLSAVITLVPADLTINSNTPVFILEAEILDPYLTSNDGVTIHLRSGLSAEARLIVDSDTALRMILRKLDFVV